MADLTRVRLGLDPVAVVPDDLVDFEGETPGEGAFTCVNDRDTVFLFINSSALAALVITVEAAKDEILTPNGIVEVADLTLTIDAADDAGYIVRIPPEVYNDVFGKAVISYVGAGLVWAGKFPRSLAYECQTEVPDGLTFDPKIVPTQALVELALQEVTTARGCAFGRNAIWFAVNNGLAAKELSIAGKHASFAGVNFGGNLGIMDLTDSTFATVPFAPAIVSIPNGTDELYAFVRPLGALRAAPTTAYYWIATEGNAPISLARVDLP